MKKMWKDGESVILIFFQLFVFINKSTIENVTHKTKYGKRKNFSQI